MHREKKNKDFKQQVWIADLISPKEHREPDFFISRCGSFEGQGQFSMNYIAPYPFLYVFLDGETAVEIDDQSITARAGDILFVFKGQQKKLCESKTAPLKNFYIDLQGSAVESILKSMAIDKENQFFHGNFDKTLVHIFDELTVECQKQITNPIKLSSLGWRLLDAIQTELPQENLVLLEACERIRLLIEKDFRFGLTITEIAQKVALSRSTVFRQFKEKYKISPKQYLEELRLNFACDQVKSSNITVAEIALNSGYNSVNHFIRMFKKHFKKTPLQYQKDSRH